jgi:tetratricopeptide (TPR) repeat protein/tRNA A-37 threonylcarbamoyl transferase component Bud32
LSALPPAEARHIDQTCDRFEAAWKAGPRPDPAEYLGAASGRVRSALLRQLLLLDWEYRERASEQPSLRDYQMRFPEATSLIEDVGREVNESSASTVAWSDETASVALASPGDRAPQLPGEVAEADTGGARYDLLREVGHGGIGVVYRGRDRHLGRELAVKVLRDDYRDKPDARRRFTEEARVGSQLQHPAIVPVYELGCFRDGRLYFTMKLVEGHTLAALLRGRPDPGQELAHLLGVFEQVCQAMAYAHAQGVIHRDLKPANIMVGAFGEVQVMDWGFAKFLAADGEGSAGKQAGVAWDSRSSVRPGTGPDRLTHSGALMGTPSYMPPEQARGEVALVDSRADVFALGAILCEILTGRPPYRGESADEVCRQAAAGDLADAHARLDACGADEALRSLARRCLAAERSVRPPDADILAQEITTYLASAQERLRRAELERAAAEARVKEAGAKARAERRVVQLALALAAALLLGTGIAAWQAIAATRAKESALAAKTDAEKKEADTLALVNFLQDRIIAPAQPKGRYGGMGPDVTLRKALEASLPFLDKSFTDKPHLEARLRLTLADAFLELGDARTAARQFETAHALYADILGAGHHDTLLALDGIARSYSSQGHYEAARKVFEQTLALRKVHLGPEDPETNRSMNNLGLCYFWLERYPEATNLLEEALALESVTLGREHRNTLRTMTNLANCYQRTDQLEKALDLREKAVALQASHFGREDLDTLMGMNNLAALYRKLKRYDDARRTDAEALALRRETMGPDHADTLCSMWGLAKDLINLHRGAEAIPILDDCLPRAAGQHVHPNFPEVADLRLHYYDEANDAAECRKTAELWEKLGRTDAGSLYQAACCRAVTAKVLHGTDSSEAAVQEAAAEGDRAMTWLKQAVAAGYRNAANVKTDKRLDALRERADFRALLGELEVGKKIDQQ